MPEGRRLLAGVHNGEFMLWNGMSFNFETVTAMGSSSLRTAEWSNKQDWLVAELGDAVDTMRVLKRALDPGNLMNPGKIFSP